MPLKWTNRSRPPSSGVMKPKPLSSLNHLTVPVPIRASTSLDAPSTDPAAGPDADTLTGGCRGAQGEICGVRGVRGGVAAAHGARAAAGARDGLRGEAHGPRP